MALALADIFKAFAEYLAALGVKNVALGQEQLGRNESPPRVTWVPTTERYELPTSTWRFLPGQPPPVMMRVAGVAIHVWGSQANTTDPDPYRELRATELLADQVLFCLKKVAPGSALILNGATWADVSDNQKGRKIVIDVAFRIPVLAPTTEAPTLADVTNIPRQGSISDTGGTDTDTEDDGLPAS
jgi:hypothetical protein